MAFHITHAPRRNALLEGVVNGHSNAASEASQMRLLERKNQLEQQGQQQQLSALEKFGLLPSSGEEGQQPQSGSDFLQNLDPIQSAAAIAALPIDKQAKNLLHKAIEIRRKEADIPVDVFTKSALDAFNFTENDLNEGILLPEEFEKLGELKRYLAKNAKSQKDIPRLTFEFLENKDKEALNNFVDESKTPKETLFKEKKAAPNSLSERRLAKKFEVKEAEEARQLAKKQEPFNKLVDLLEKGNVGRGSSAHPGALLGGETAEDIGEFESLTGALEGALVKEVNKGALSNTRFKYITDTLLPKSGDTQATIRGKLKGLAATLGLDASRLQKKEKSTKVKHKDESIRSNELKPGFIEDGYRYKGGPINKEESWEKVDS